MSVPYQQLLHSVGLRMNALVGAQFGPLETTYGTAILTAVNFKSADWPFSSFRDAILMAEEEFAWAIADTGEHPWRRFLWSVTTALANQATLPSTDSTGKPIIGIFGAVSDSSDGTPCTEQPLEVIRRVVQETWRVYQLYYYKMQGANIYHTRPNVLVECCIYNRADRLTVWNANGNMLLPDVLEPAITARAVSLMTRDNAYADQASIYRAYSNEALTEIRKGLTSIPNVTLPGPTPAVRAA